jgi:hypothetical protein
MEALTRVLQDGDPGSVRNPRQQLAVTVRFGPKTV